MTKFVVGIEVGGGPKRKQEGSFSSHATRANFRMTGVLHVREQEAAQEKN